MSRKTNILPFTTSTHQVLVFRCDSISRKDLCQSVSDHESINHQVIPSSHAVIKSCRSVYQTNSATKPITSSKYRIYRLLVLFYCVNVDICFRHKLGCLLRFDIMLRLRAGHKSSIAEVVLNQSDLILPSVNTPQTLASDNILGNRWPRIVRSSVM